MVSIDVEDPAKQRRGLSSPGIYAIVHKESGRAYVGQSVNMAHRLNKHRSELCDNKHHCAHLQNAWNKYGADAFEFQALEYVDERSALSDRENAYIHPRSTLPLYNIARKANSCLGVVRSEETRRRHRERWAKLALDGVIDKVMRPFIDAGADARRGIPLTAEHRAKIAANVGKPFKGRRHTQETRAIIAAQKRGKPGHNHSEEYKERMSRQRCTVPDDVVLEAVRKVLCMGISQDEAVRGIGLTQTMLSKVILGKRRAYLQQSISDIRKDLPRRSKGVGVFCIESA